MSNATNIRLGLIVTDLIAGVASARSAIAGLSRQINSDLISSFSAADRASRQYDRGLGRLGKNLTSFGQTASIASAGVALLGAQAFSTYANINALQLGLESVTGSAAGATARFAELREVARLPGLGLEEAIRGDVKLRAVGFSATVAKDALLQFGNAIALTGGGKFELDSVLTQLTQMGSKTRVLSEDLKPILNASPKVAAAIKAMFGTVDSEQISATLQAAGRGPKQFIEDLIKNLSGLERVKGGPKNAIENFGDSVKIAGFRFGEAADRAFGLTTKLDGLGNFVGNLADRFAGLSPVTQSIILGVAATTAVVGPLTLAIGGLLALVPSVIAGFSALSGIVGVAVGPIVLAGIAIAGVAALVIANWSTVKTYLTDSGIWESLRLLVTTTIAAVTSVFGIGTDALVTLWERFGGFFVGIAKTAFDAVGAGFNAGAGLLTGIVQVMSGLLTGSLSKTFTGLLTIAKTGWNAVVDVFRVGIGLIGRALSATVQLFGGTDLAKTINKGIDDALVKINALKANIQTVAASPAIKVLTPVLKPTKTGPVEAAFDYKALDLGKSAVKALREELKKLKDEIQSISVSGGKVPADKLARVAEINRQLKAANKLTAPPKTVRIKAPTAENQFGDLALNERIAKRLALEVQNLGKNAPIGLLRQLAAVQDRIEEIKALTDNKKTELGEIKPIDNRDTTTRRVNDLTGTFNGARMLPGATDFLSSLTENVKLAKAELAQNLAAIRAEYASFPAFLRLLTGQIEEAVPNPALLVGAVSVLSAIPGASIGTQLTKTIDEVKAKTAVLKLALEGLRSVVGSGFADALSAVGESIVTGKTDPLKAALKTILGSIADYMIQIGTAMLLASKFLGLASLFNPTLVPLSVGQGVAGAGLIVGGGLIKALVPAFADGGIVSGPTLAMVGEYPGANRNKEIIAPLSDLTGILRGVLGESGGGGYAELAVRGDNLRTVQRRNQAGRVRYGRG